MDTSRVTAAVLDAAPVALVAVLAAWAFSDFLTIPRTLVEEGFAAALLVGLAGLLLGFRFHLGPLRRGGLALVGLSYLGAHLFALPLDPAPAIAFLTLVLGVAELRILGERFAPILRADLDDGTRPLVHEALGRCVLRLAAASALGFLGATLTADVALSGSLPLRSITTALVLSLLLIAVVLVLAFWPSIEAYLQTSHPPETPIQTPK